MTNAAEHVTKTRQYATAYLRAGFLIIPIPIKSKNPNRRDWQKERYTAEQVPQIFSTPKNIGTILGEGLVDIDLDCPEAIRLAPYYLPITRTFGRASKPSSHWFYKCENPKPYKKFTVCIQKDTIVEYRAKGCQTVFPPSIHESGEEIDFDNKESIATVDGLLLFICVSRLAAASLLLRYMVEGVRDDLITTMTGVLLRGGWSSDDIDIFLIPLVNAADFSYSSKAEYQRERLAKGDNVYGVPKLKEQVGEEATKCILDWLCLKALNEKEAGNLSDEEKTVDAIEELNKNHFVSKEGGKTFVFSEGWDERMGRNVLNRSYFMDFQNFHLNILVYAGKNKAGESVYKSRGEVWLKHPDRRQYNGITLEPGKDTPGYYNLWRGFSVNPVSGSWKRMKRHIFNIICSRNKKAYRYVIGWLATATQKPGEQAEVALVFRGKRGTGKGIVGNNFCKLFGGNAAHVTNSKYVTGNFNSHLRDVVFLFADEAFWAGDKSGESVLKGLITEPTLTIEGKGRDVVFVRNMLHILMASNNDWVVPAGLEERRFCVLDVSDKRIQDKAYFTALAEEMETGGLGAMLYDLQNYDLSRYQIRDVPQTRGLFEQKLQSLDDFQQWWFHRLSEGELMPGLGFNFIPCAILYASYMDNLSSRAVRHRSGETVFGLSLKKVLPEGWPKKKFRSIPGQKQVNQYEFPPLDKCRNHFESLIKSKVVWGE